MYYVPNVTVLWDLMSNVWLHEVIGRFDDTCLSSIVGIELLLHVLPFKISTHTQLIFLHSKHAHYIILHPFTCSTGIKTHRWCIRNDGACNIYVISCVEQRMYLITKFLATKYCFQTTAATWVHTGFWWLACHFDWLPQAFSVHSRSYG